MLGCQARDRQRQWRRRGRRRQPRPRRRRMHGRHAACAFRAGLPQNPGIHRAGTDNVSRGKATMTPEPGTHGSEAAMDAASLYREETYTDRKIGTLRVLVPVKSDGSPDTARPALYQGEAQLMTNMGPLPISFDIE